MSRSPQTCWGQVSDASHHTRSEVTGLNEVNERLESVPAQCDVQNSRISSKADFEQIVIVIRQYNMHADPSCFESPPSLLT